MLHTCDQGCEVDIGMSKSRELHRCEPHNEVLKYGKPLSRSTPPSNPSSPKRRKQGLKRGRGFAVAPKQREKVAGLACLYCGAGASDYVAIDPAHLWPRGKGGCDDELCVGPLCRYSNGEGCHRLFDEGKLDLLPRLLDHGYFPEIAHAIEAHQLSPLTLLERLTGSEWVERDKEFADG